MASGLDRLSIFYEDTRCRAEDIQSRTWRLRYCSVLVHSKTRRNLLPKYIPSESR